VKEETFVEEVVEEAKEDASRAQAEHEQEKPAE
jgi:hypothetical protein